MLTKTNIDDILSVLKALAFDIAKTEGGSFHEVAVYVRIYLMFSLYIK